MSDPFLKAISDWLKTSSGLVADESGRGPVHWVGQRAPRPNAPYIAVTLSGDREVCHDWMALSDVSATFTAAASDVVTSAGHGLSTGDGPFRLNTTASDLPLNLLTGTDYWIIAINANTYYLATSLVDALAGTRVDIGDAGTGTHTITVPGADQQFTMTGPRVEALKLECFATDELWATVRPERVLRRILACRRLPSIAQAFRTAGIGFGPVGAVTTQAYERSQLFEPRASVTISLHSISQVSELGTWIERVEITPTIKTPEGTTIPGVPAFIEPPEDP